MNVNMERRFVSAKVAPIEVRTAADGAKVITGHALVYDRLSQDLGGFVERCASGCATKTIKEGDIRALFNHDPNVVLGRTAAGTLRLADDTQGVGYEIDPPSCRADVLEALQRGDVTQSSFTFRCIGDSWAVAEGRALRTLEEVAISDVSPVTFPAYLDTDSGVRSALSHLAERRSISPDEAVAIFRGGHLPDLIAGRKVPDSGRPAPRSLIDPTYSDRERIIAAALAKTAGDCWLRDMTESWVVYQSYSYIDGMAQAFKADYTLDADGNVTLGQPVAVVVNTTYQPVGTVEADTGARRLELLRRRYPAA